MISPITTPRNDDFNFGEMAVVPQHSVFGSNSVTKDKSHQVYNDLDPTGEVPLSILAS